MSPYGHQRLRRIHPRLLLDDLSLTRAGTRLELATRRRATRHPVLKRLWTGLNLVGSGMGSRHTQPSLSTVLGRRNGYLLPTPHPRAGIGHRLSSWISAYSVAQRLDLTLLYRAQDSLWDAEFGLDMDPAWTPGANRGHNFFYLPPAEDDEDLSAWNLIEKEVERRRSEMAVFRLAMDHPSYTQDAGGRELARRYWMRHAPPETGGPLLVSVHLRRGDVTAAMAQRHRGLEYFERVLEAVLEGTRGTPVSLTIHTQGEAPELALPRDCTLVMDVDGDPADTMLLMASSDILITSPSSFSVTAGFLSRGLVLREEPWWHSFPQDDRWLAVLTDGGLPTEACLKKITRRVASFVA